MKRFVVIIFAALIAMSVCRSCRIYDVPVKYRIPGFVSEYLILDNDNAKAESCVADGKLSLMLNVYASYNEVVAADEYMVNGKTDSEYYKLCLKFGDLYYNQKVSVFNDGYIDDNNVNVIADVVTDIRIVSDDDWNSEYTAGTLLNEQFSLKYYTVYPYVESRYKTQNITAVDDAVTDMPELSLKMMMYDHDNRRALLPSDWGSFTFLKLYTDRLPENPIQSLHITLTTDDGKTLEYSVEVDLN